jgi:hypothetical protein
MNRLYRQVLPQPGIPLHHKVSNVLTGLAPHRMNCPTPMREANTPDVDFANLEWRELLINHRISLYARILVYNRVETGRYRHIL